MSENAYQINVSRDDFSKLLNLLKIFENSCTDCDIQNGQFRCRTNDRQAIISMDLSSILQTNNLSFSLIKNKIALLKTFELDDNVQLDNKTVSIESNDSNYEIHDPLSRMIFRKPIQRYIDNQYIPEEDFNQMIRISEDNLIFSYTINNYMKRRISNIAMGFQTDIIICQMTSVDDEPTASLLVSTTNHEDSSTVAKGITMNRDIGNRQFKMLALPFVLDMASDLVLSCYHVSQDVALCKFSQTFYGAPISIYAQVKVTNM
jgi:hypothetical protein